MKKPSGLHPGSSNGLPPGLPRAILFDIDGVLIHPPGFFSAELERSGYAEASVVLNEFFRTPGEQQCTVGKNDILMEIEPVLPQFGWDHGTSEYFRQKYAWERQFILKDVFHQIAKLRRHSLCCLATDQNAHRADFLLNDCGFNEHFDYPFVSCSLGYRKIHQGFWDQALAKLNDLAPAITPGEILYFDDRQSNLDCAGNFGIQTHLVSEAQAFIAELDRLIQLADDYPHGHQDQSI